LIQYESVVSQAIGWNSTGFELAYGARSSLQNQHTSQAVIFISKVGENWYYNLRTYPITDYRLEAYVTLVGNGIGYKHPEAQSQKPNRRWLASFK
jgi:hypothetical protein